MNVDNANTLDTNLTDRRSDEIAAVKISRAIFNPRLLLIKVIAVVTLGSGLLNLYSVAARHLPERLAIIDNIFPLEFIHLSNFLVMLSGFALVISSINIYKRKKRAFQGVLALSGASIFFHLTRSLNYEEAAVSLLLIVLLLFARKSFTVKSSVQTIPTGLLWAASGLAVALLYGTAGFWFIEKRHFGVNFHWNDAFMEALKFITFAGDPDLEPLTRHANWFIDSLYVMGITQFAYAIYSLYRPVIFRFRIYPQERQAAHSLIEKHGRSALDYFKAWPDKSFYFSKSQESFLAYGVGNSFALVLGDPVGPESEIAAITQSFMDYCAGNDWGMALYQTRPDFLSIYDRLGLRKLKIGDDAVVDLEAFEMEGRARKSIRQAVKRIEEQGFKDVLYEPPVPDEIVEAARGISDRWLAIGGHRERRFTLGLFETDYVRSTPLIVAIDKDGNPKAFINQIPSYVPGEATIDLMRRAPDSPNGIMDYLFIKLFLRLKAKGAIRFNLGMAPMSGFAEHEQSSAEEKAIHFFFQHMNFVFQYRGLRHFKAKYATIWEPRYAIYRNALDLPKMALALKSITEIKGKLHDHGR